MRARTSKRVEVVCFAFWFFLRSKPFRKKMINRLEIVLIVSYALLLTYALSTHLSRSYLYALVFICDHLWESFLFIRIFLVCDFLSLYENKLVYESHHLKQIFYHQNRIMISCWFRIFQVYVFYLNSSHFVSEYFSIK